jgi:hypothetical protein
MVRRILLLFPTLLFAHVHLAAAQQPAKIPRIGFLESLSASSDSSQSRAEGFQQGLRELGYVDGKKTLSLSTDMRMEARKAPRSSGRVSPSQGGHPGCEGRTCGPCC